MGIKLIIIASLLLSMIETSESNEYQDKNSKYAIIKNDNIDLFDSPDGKIISKSTCNEIVIIKDKRKNWTNIIKSIGTPENKIIDCWVKDENIQFIDTTLNNLLIFHKIIDKLYINNYTNKVYEFKKIDDNYYSTKFENAGNYEAIFQIHLFQDNNQNIYRRASGEIDQKIDRISDYFIFYSNNSIKVYDSKSFQYENFPEYKMTQSLSKNEKIITKDGLIKPYKANFNYDRKSKSMNKSYRLTENSDLQKIEYEFKNGEFIELK